jgi:Tol biopolymer transport system component
MRSKQLASSLSRLATIAAVLITALVTSSAGSRAETAGLTAGAFPGKNGALAVVKDRYRTDGSGNGTGIVLVAPDGSGLHWFSTGRGRDPSWSPDGKTLLFTRGQRLWIADQRGRHETKISTTSSSGVDEFESPEWSADGAQIVFEGFGPSAFGIYSARLIGARLTQMRLVHRDSAGDWEPAWSPVAPEIAFVWSSYRDKPFKLVLARADGSFVHVLTASGLGIAWPSWSPDGSTIAFTRCVYQEGAWLSLIDRDGSNLRNIVRLPKHSCNVATAWSPDGTQIAFVSDVSLGHTSLDVVAVDGTSQRTILQNIDGCCRITWQPLRG